MRKLLCLNSAVYLGLFSPVVLAGSSPSDKDPEAIVVSAQALKVNTDLQETPRSVSVISQQQLETHAPQKLDEALRYTSGVVCNLTGRIMIPTGLKCAVLTRPPI
ncbi:TonB-dependent receptor plug domain-containing protein [Moellerella wisconsensis]|uniref:TonB-dependent receptor plug domain-containing protein n=1 Tax=Moellerella wisconsensis TaxID=158849 RepID=UPI0022B179F4|nr:TonB-dependent receptor plug domain-containing protein [Moellerella wisconsensis]